MDHIWTTLYYNNGSKRFTLQELGDNALPLIAPSVRQNIAVYKEGFNFEYLFDGAQNKWVRVNPPRFVSLIAARPKEISVVNLEYFLRRYRQGDLGKRNLGITFHEDLVISTILIEDVEKFWRRVF